MMWKCTERWWDGLPIGFRLGGIKCYTKWIIDLVALGANKPRPFSGTISIFVREWRLMKVKFTVFCLRKSGWFWVIMVSCNYGYWFKMKLNASRGETLELGRGSANWGQILEDALGKSNWLISCRSWAVQVTWHQKLSIPLADVRMFSISYFANKLKANGHKNGQKHLFSLWQLVYKCYCLSRMQIDVDINL